jgi:DNA repair exonuclease SbcCD ATPase subunit
MRLTLRKTICGTIGAWLLIAPLFVSTLKAEVRPSDTATSNWAYTEEASGLLKEVRSLSAQLADDAHELEMYAGRNQLDWRSHAFQLNQIRDHINAMGEKLERLQEIRGMLAPWQREAVDRVVPNAQELAAHAEAAIAYLNEQQDRLWMPAYVDRISAMTDHAEEIKSSVTAFLDYAKALDRLKQLESQLEISGA